ncbi:MAG: alpha/beta hydrolase [Hyphomicrobiales bacterium]
MADGLAAAEQLAKRGIAPGDTVLHGESLGAGVAVQVATRHRFRGLVLEAPFTSAVDVAVKAYPYLPARWLMHDRFESVDHIANVGAPVLIVHGAADELIPVAFGRTLHEAAAEPKSLMIVPNAGHSELDQPEVRARIEAFIEDPTAVSAD